MEYLTGLPEIKDTDKLQVSRYLFSGVTRELSKKQLEALKPEKYVPFPAGKDTDDLGTIKIFSRRIGRVAVESSVAIEQLKEEFGDDEQLIKNFNNSGGLVDEEQIEAIIDVVRSLDPDIDGKRIRENINELGIVSGPTLGNRVDLLSEPVLDFVDGEYKAYHWPYLAIHRPHGLNLPEGMSDEVKTGLAKGGVKPWRVFVKRLMPGVQREYESVCIYLGK